MSKIFLCHPNDDVGQTIPGVLNNLLKVVSLSLVANVTYSPSTFDYTSCMSDMPLSTQAIIINGVSQDVAGFISLAKKTKSSDMLYFTDSLVGTDDLQDYLGSQASNVYVTQVVPDPMSEIGDSCNQVLSILFPNLTCNWDMLEGYILGKFITATLQLSGRIELPSDFLNTLYGERNIPVDELTMGPFSDGCNYNSTSDCFCNYGLGDIWMIRLNNDGSYTAIPEGQLSFRNDCTYNVSKLLVPIPIVNLKDVVRDGSQANWEIIIPSIAGGLILFIAIVVGYVTWVLTTERRKLAQKYNTTNIAIECAEAISKLDLEAVAYLHTIPNPNRVQQAFARIVYILQEVRTYVPEGLLARLKNVDDDNEQDHPVDHSEIQLESTRNSEQHHRNSNQCLFDIESHPSTSTSHSIDQLNEEQQAQQKQQLNTSDKEKKNSPFPSMAKDIPKSKLPPSNSSLVGIPTTSAPGWKAKRVTILSIYLDASKQTSVDGMRQLTISAIQIVVQCIKSYQGTLEILSTLEVVASWGASHYSSESQRMACGAALMIREKLSSSAISCYIGIAHSWCLVGTVTTGNNSAIVIVGNSIFNSRKLSDPYRHNMLGTYILCDHSIHEVSQYWYVMRVVDFIQHPNTMELVYELKEERPTTHEDEWLYQIQYAQKQEPLYIAAFTSIVNNNLTEAMESITTHLKHNPADKPTIKLLSWLKESLLPQPSSPFLKYSRGPTFVEKPSRLPSVDTIQIEQFTAI
eukprot:NODE_216_length_3216_cov_27.121010_g187_i0.p1 GENE.NODE_216_length_3216_cov_27.121010_g187_i0~~NODE_216_length_3216_cov_27.121010_g187_i0.p1  ORF type:complete len:744 (-),score=136.31 NODE_216_length_3216_cov_27.121010_g187_i0:726-2957(-)